MAPPSGSATSLTSPDPPGRKYPLRQNSTASRLVVATFTKRKNLKRLALKAVRFRFRLVGTTGHSPDGESVLHGCFSSAMLPSASRRTCARRNSFTHNGMSACASPACLGRARGSRPHVSDAREVLAGGCSRSIAKRTVNTVLFAMLVGTTGLEPVTSCM